MIDGLGKALSGPTEEKRKKKMRKLKKKKKKRGAGIRLARQRRSH